MARRNPNRKSRKKNSRRDNLPLWLREKNILTQQQLLLALMPYMEWISLKDLTLKFWKIIDYHIDDSPVRGMLRKLLIAGYVEHKTGALPPVNPKSGFQGKPYAYFRRISKKAPAAAAEEIRRAGTVGAKAIQQRARARLNKKKTVSPLTVTKLTMKDVLYIRDNPHGTNIRATAQMFRITLPAVVNIRNGRLPKHLRGQPVQSLPEDNQAEI